MAVALSFLPSDQRRPVHPLPLVLGVLVGDAEPEGVPVASGEKIPQKRLAGGEEGDSSEAVFPSAPR